VLVFHFLPGGGAAPLFLLLTIFEERAASEVKKLLPSAFAFEKEKEEGDEFGDKREEVEENVRVEEGGGRGGGNGEGKREEKQKALT
jgi:hypothetical protein